MSSTSVNPSNKLKSYILNPVGKSTISVIRRGFITSSDSETEVTLTSTSELLVKDVSIEDEDFKFAIPSIDKSPYSEEDD